jgi:hypothetical protein
LSAEIEALKALDFDLSLTGFSLDTAPDQLRCSLAIAEASELL